MRAAQRSKSWYCTWLRTIYQHHVLIPADLSLLKNSQLTVIFSTTAACCSCEKKPGVCVHIGILCSTVVQPIYSSDLIYQRKLRTSCGPDQPGFLLWDLPPSPAWPKSPKRMVEIPHIVLKTDAWSQYLYWKV